MLIGVAVFFGLVEALFTAFEVALGAVSRARLRSLVNEANRESMRESDEETVSPVVAADASRVLALLERPDRLTLLFITVTSLALWTAASALTWALMRGDNPWWVLVGAFVLLLFVAEVLPLLFASRHAETVALRGSRFIKGALRLLSPFLWLVGGVSFAIARAMGSGPNASPHVTAGELRTALAAAEEEGTLPSEERALIEGALDMRETTVREVMTPRPDIIGIPADATLFEALDVALRAGHSRLPVYDGSLDRIVGVLATKDLLPHLRATDNEAKRARDVLRTPYYLPEAKRVAAALDELRHGSTLLAVVVDDNGGTAGLVTLEDLLEEIVGEIQDEYDEEELPLRVFEDGALLGTISGETPGMTRGVACEGQTPVREFGRFFAREFKMRTTLVGRNGEPVESGRSLASLALELFESVPAEGDRTRAGIAVASTPDIEVRVGLDLLITRMDGPRIAEIAVVPVEETNVQEQEAGAV